MSGNKDFESVWQRFTSLCRGKLVEKSGQAPLTTAAARTAVAAASTVWTDKYDPCGKWLNDLKIKDESKAKRIAELMESIEFVDVPCEKTISDLSIVGVTVGGAIAGAGISRAFKAALPVGVASTVLPALVLYPAMKSVQKTQRDNSEKNLVNEFVGQLENVRRIAEEILSEGS